MINCDVFKFRYLSHFQCCTCRQNLRLAIEKTTQTFEVELVWLLKDLRINRKETDKVIVFCESIDHCQQIYNWMMSELLTDAYIDGHLLIENRFVEMFHRGTTEKTKERIIKIFREVDSTLRIVVSTIAFGMGINIPNVRTVVLWGLPDSVLDLWQLMGRGGRDGLPSSVMCYCFPRSMLCRECRSSKCECKYSTKCVIQKALCDKLCFRHEILQFFAFTDEMKDNLPTKEKKTCLMLNCVETCNCESCLCCTACSALCTCQNKLKIRTHLY